MDTAKHLRCEGRRIVPRRDERPKGTAALRSVSYAFRQHKKWQAFQRRKAADEAARAARMRDWRRDGVLDSMRASGLGDIADGYEVEKAVID